MYIGSYVYKLFTFILFFICVTNIENSWIIVCIKSVLFSIVNLSCIYCMCSITTQNEKYIFHNLCLILIVIITVMFIMVDTCVAKFRIRALSVYSLITWNFQIPVEWSRSLYTTANVHEYIRRRFRVYAVVTIQYEAWPCFVQRLCKQLAQKV